MQYRETDLAFICRLMEEEGIFYYFTHDGQEMMVLGDSTSRLRRPAPRTPRSSTRRGTGELSTSEEYLSDLRYRSPPTRAR